MLSEFNKTPLNTVHRLAKRAHYDAETVYSIVDAAAICHVGFADENGQPFVIPTIHARIEDTIYLHGSRSSRMLQHISSGAPVCITVTHLDGLVLARSTFHSSMNYRSAMLFGVGHEVEDDAAKLAAMAALTEKLMPGRWEDTRPVSERELKATSMIGIDIQSASAKVRTGGPIDDEEDYALPIWAGVIPVTQTFGQPINDERMAPETPLPLYIADYLGL